MLLNHPQREVHNTYSKSYFLIEVNSYINFPVIKSDFFGKSTWPCYGMEEQELLRVDARK